MKRLCDAVRQCLTDAGLLHARLLCAVSGGADSVALLHALKEMDVSLTALHVQHGLRGEASEADEAFVRDLCAQLRIPLIVRHAQLTGTMDDPGIESRARDERLRIIHQVMTEGCFDAVLLGHHRDDQAETVLMRLLRGSGMTGLGGMRPISGNALRPFLGIPKADIVSALRCEHLSWREDESNFHPTNPRNALRLNILPAMETLYPGAGKHIAQTADVLRTEDDYLEAEAQKLFEQSAYCVPPFRLIAKQPLADAHPALVRRVLRKLCPAPLDHAETLALEALLHQPDGAALNLPQGAHALVWTHHLHISHPTDQAADAVHLTIHSAPADGRIPRSAAEVILPPGMPYEVRLPKQDDTIHPFGAPGAKPLRRFYTDRKVDPRFRWSLPALACGDEILWIPGLCASEKLRLAAVPEGAIRLSFTVSIPFYPYQTKE